MEITPLLIQQYTTVRIHIHNEIGSGVVCYPYSGDYIYILTAKHVIFGKNFVTPFKNTDIIIDKIVKSDGDFNFFQVQEEDQVIASESNLVDLCIICIKKDKTVSIFCHELSSDYIVDTFGLTDCQLRGFPFFADNNQSRSIQCSFKEFMPGSSNFLVESKSKLDTIYSDVNENVRGLSGGGVFITFDYKSYLLGIVTQFANIDSFICQHTGAINRLLKQNGLAELKIETLVVDQNVLTTMAAFKANRKIVSTKIRNKIGTIHIQRSNSKKVAADLLIKQLLVLDGNAGVGKSAFAGEVVEQLLAYNDYELFLFTGEQFSFETIDQVLEGVGAKINTEALISSVHFNRKKLFWIESIEKLLETGKIEAFIELLSLANSNTEIKILVTIRSYMLQQFKLRFAWNFPAEKVFFEIPLLSEAEMELIHKAYPELQQLLTNQKLKYLLQIPFYLKYAVDILPVLKEAGDLDEEKFKKIMWDNIIDANTSIRGSIFEEVAVKRAKEMALYVKTTADPAIIRALYENNLLSIEQKDPAEKYAPSHDVLEDWALMRYIKRHKKDSSSPKEFLVAIGTEPSIRRAFRLWLGEALQNLDSELSQFIQATIASQEIENYWKDEIYISILKSNYSDNFFTENEKLLLSNSGSLISKFIHLLKTACKDNNPLTGYFEPVGSGWATMVRFLYAHKDGVKDRYPFFLSFLLDWQHKIYTTKGFFFPEESREAALLLLEILVTLKSTFSKSYNRTAIDYSIEMGIGVLFNLAKVIPEELDHFIKDAEKGLDKPGEQQDFRGIEFNREVVNSSIDGLKVSQVTRYLPDTVIGILQRKMQKKPETRGDRDYFSGTRERKTEDLFGIAHNHDYTCYPASIYQTPALALLRFHQEKGLDFVLYTINNATDSYVKLQADSGDIQVINIPLGDGIEVTQSGDYLLWVMYRGFHSTPAYLQSLLMALEQYLFELAEGEKNDSIYIQNIFFYLLAKSRSVAITSVLASVALRFPKIVGKGVLPLFTSKHFFFWEMQRYSSELPMVSMGGMFGPQDEYEKERQTSNALPHRQIHKGLSMFIVDHQFYDRSLNDSIFKILDKLNEELATEDNVLIQKLLQEIDTRKWDIVQIDETDPEKPKVLVGPIYEGAAKEMLESGKDEMERGNIDARFATWIEKVYKETPDLNATYKQWKKTFKHYTTGQLSDMIFSNPGRLAITGLRDFQASLNKKERNWCVDAICSHVAKLMDDRNSPDFRMRLEAYNILETEPCLEFMPSLVSFITTKKGIKDFKTLILRLLISNLHPNELNHLLVGIRSKLWPLDKDFAYRCVYFLIAYAHLAEKERKWSDDYGNRDDAKKERAIKLLINCSLKNEIKIDLNTLHINHNTHWFYRRAFILVPGNTEYTHLIDLCNTIVNLNLATFDNDQRDDGAMTYHEIRNSIADFYPEMLLVQTDNLYNAVNGLYDKYAADEIVIMRYGRANKKKEFIAKIIRNLIKTLGGMLKHQNKEQMIANFFKVLEILHSRNVSAQKFHFTRELLLNYSWTNGFDHWEPFDQKSVFITELINTYGQFDIEATLHLLSSVGRKKLMPAGVSLVANILRNSHRDILLIGSEWTDIFIQRSFYEFGRSIKQSKFLLDDFILILDHRVNAGSSEAYLIREDLITFK